MMSFEDAWASSKADQSICACWATCKDSVPHILWVNSTCCQRAVNLLNFRGVRSQAGCHGTRQKAPKPGPPVRFRGSGRKGMLLHNCLFLQLAQKLSWQTPAQANVPGTRLEHCPCTNMALASFTASHCLTAVKQRLAVSESIAGHATLGGCRLH